MESGSTSSLSGSCLTWIPSGIGDTEGRLVLIGVDGVKGGTRGVDGPDDSKRGGTADGFVEGEAFGVADSFDFLVEPRGRPRTLPCLVTEGVETPFFLREDCDDEGVEDSGRVFGVDGVAKPLAPLTVDAFGPVSVPCEVGVDGSLLWEDIDLMRP